MLSSKYAGPFVPLGALISVLQGYKLICPIFQKEAPSLHSKAVHDINIFEKGESRTKAVSVSICKMYRMQKTYRELFSQQQAALYMGILMKKEVCLEGVAKNPEDKDTALKDNGPEVTLRENQKKVWGAISREEN